MKQIYELIWSINVLDYEFPTCQYKVFNSWEEACAFGRGEEEQCNRGLSRWEAANEGYYYKFLGANPIDSIDGYRVILRVILEE